MGGDIKREQTAVSESQVNTRQDRNTFLTDGGTWTWNYGTRTLSWSADVKVRRGGLVTDTITGPDSVVLAGAGAARVLYAVVDRTTGGATLTPGVEVLDAAENSAVLLTDGAVAVGIIGLDTAFYFRNGTVMADGDVKQFGTLNSLTDRQDVSATGSDTYASIAFSYVVGSNQLAVYVGGILLLDGLHYNEVGVAGSLSTTIIFTAGNIPLTGELISFVNIVGGQGPAGGSTSLQLGYDTGRHILTASSATPVNIHNASGPPIPVLTAGIGTADADRRFYVLNSGSVISGRTGAANAGESGFFFQDSAAGADAAWAFVPLDDGSGDAILYNNGSGQGIRLEKSTGAMAFGAYAGTYPGGTWTDEGTGGALQWAIITGTIPSNPTGGPETVNLGLSTMIATLISIDDNGIANFALSSDFGGTTIANKQHSVMFNNTSGDIDIAITPGSVSQFGSNIEGEAYTLIVFYQ